MYKDNADTTYFFPRNKLFPLEAKDRWQHEFFITNFVSNPFASKVLLMNDFQHSHREFTASIKNIVLVMKKPSYYKACYKFWLATSTNHVNGV